MGTSDGAGSDQSHFQHGMISNSQQLRLKRTFFATFEELTRDSDEEQDLGRQASEQALKNIPKRILTSKPVETGPIDQSNADHVLPSRLSRPSPRAGFQTRSQASSPPDVPPEDLNRLQVPRDMIGDVSEIARRSPALTDGRAMTSSANKSTAGSKKLFDGLHFYFFPNNDVAPARRMRIAKAIEIGAKWQKQWNDSVTHAILDKSVELGQLLKFLYLDSLPGHVLAVTENYPSECIGFRVILDPVQSRFMARGFDGPPKAAQTKEAQSSNPDKYSHTKSARSGIHSRETERESPAVEAQKCTSGDVGHDHLVLSDEPDQQDLGTERVPDSFSKPDVESNADLDEAISQARALHRLPLDDDDESPSRPSTSEGQQSDNERGCTLQFMKNKKIKLEAIQNKFQCMQKHVGETSHSPNRNTIDILQQMADYYGQMGDEWRIRAYRRAMATLRNHPTKVCTKEEALALPNIGDRLALKIEEVVVTSRLRRLDYALAEPQDKILQTFIKIYGAGLATASKWARQGFKTLNDLLEKAELTENQRIGIQHYDDFQQRIPRSEVEQHGELVRKKLQEIDPAFRVIIGGSYRRVALDSSDIDCIITRPDANAFHIRATCVEQLIPALSNCGFLTAALALSSCDEGSKWHGACCLSGSTVWRRIDFLFVPSDELGAALIYFKGNDIFNRSLRLLARKKGMRLNQRGL